MNRKTMIGNTCRERVARSMRFDNWNDLVRFQSTRKKLQLSKVAETLINQETKLQFAGWWAMKREKEKISLPFPEKNHLEEFLNETIK